MPSSSDLPLILLLMLVSSSAGSTRVTLRPRRMPAALPLLRSARTAPLSRPTAFEVVAAPVAADEDTHVGRLAAMRRLCALMCPDTRDSCACSGRLRRMIHLGTARSSRLAYLMAERAVAAAPVP